MVYFDLGDEDKEIECFELYGTISDQEKSPHQQIAILLMVEIVRGFVKLPWKTHCIQ